MECNGTVNFRRISTCNLKCIRKMHQECRACCSTSHSRVRTKPGCKHGSSPFPRTFRLKLWGLEPCMALAWQSLKSTGGLRFSRNHAEPWGQSSVEETAAIRYFSFRESGGGVFDFSPKVADLWYKQENDSVTPTQPWPRAQRRSFRPTRLPQNPAGGKYVLKDASCVQSLRAAVSVKSDNAHGGRSSPRRHPTPKIHFYHPLLRPWPSLLRGGVALGEVV